MTDYLPDSCPDCPIVERMGFLYFCKHYNRGSMADPDHRPEYYEMKMITAEEELEYA
jgi:hypothetical protein